MNHSHWDSQAHEHADALCSAVRLEHCGAFNECQWDDFNDYDAEDFAGRNGDSGKKGMKRSPNFRWRNQVAKRRTGMR